MKRTAQIQRRIGSEQHAGRIHQVETRTSYCRSDRAVDLRLLPARDAAENIQDAGGTIKTGGIAGANAKFAEAMKLIGAFDSPAGDVKELSALCHGGAQRAVGCDICRKGGLASP